ncbi:uncharacterized protein N7483_005585 [Penicillium malachiteum]|uniref:uncharacterized protein n=1 Tax=Penicillium malachiteum TaxID=1324776 RepID=UPI00254977FD|nr:uncharacterized protein N7483_005585 [Penicillium malachiteum]KAJ5731077.1 hypothetical protein N7483_005585 [Penicillium malachiteum]
MPLGTSLIRNLRGAVLHVVSLQEAWEAERTLKLMSVKWKTKGPDLDQDQDEDEDQALAQALEQGQGQDLAPDLKEASD